ncbi:MAG: MMPL family transporter [Verrucomicrobiota bacterium]
MRRRWIFLLVGLFLAAAGAGVFGISRLSYNVDLFDLLPKDLPGLNGTRLMRDAFQQRDRLVITLEDRDPARLHAAAESLAAHLRGQPQLCVKVKSSQTALEDPDFLAGIAAYTWLNAPPEDVKTLAATLEPDALPQKLAATLEELATSTDGQAMALGAYDPLGLGARSVSLFQGSAQGSPAGDGFRSPDGRFQLIFAEAPMELKDYREAGAWLERMRNTVRSWRDSGAEFAGLAFAFTGEPAFRSEISAGMERDMKQSIGLISAIVGGLFWLLHRTVKPLFLLMLALLVTNLLTIGLAGVFFGSLNVMSIGFAAILTGMVEDFGVVGLHEAQTLKNPTWGQVARRVVPGVFWSALTAAAVFGSLALSSLPGISQLGLITAIGILTGALVMVCAFLPLALRLKLPPPHPPKPAGQGGKISPLPGWTALGLALACLAVLGMRGFPGLTSETAVLRPVGSEAYSAMERLQEKMQPGGRDGGWIPLVAYGTNEQVHTALTQASAILEKAEAAVSGAPGAAGPWFLPTPLFPCQSCQDASRAVLGQIAGRSDAIARAVGDAGFEKEAFLFTGKILALWRQWAAEAPGLRWPDTSLLEGPAGGMLTRTGETSVAMGFVTLPPGRTSAGSPLIRSLAAVPHLEPAGWDFLSAGMKALAPKEVVRICVPAGIGLAVLLWLAFRRFREIALALATLAFSGLVLVACMAAAGMDWNMVNIAAVPLSLGLGLDFTIHMIYSLRRLPAEGGDGGRGVGRALLYCGLSTGLGFGSLALSGNKGLISMGLCCTVGVLATLLTAAVLLPWAWHHWPGRRA